MLKKNPDDHPTCSFESMDVFTLNNSNDPFLYLNFFAEQISWGAIKLSRFENGDTRYGK